MQRIQVYMQGNTKKCVKKYRLLRRNKSEQNEIQLNVKKYLLSSRVVCTSQPLEWQNPILGWVYCTFKLI